MDTDKLKSDIILYSKTIGIDKIGFATADPFEELKVRLLNQRALGYESGFEESDIEKRVDPTKIFPGARSIISIALAYPSKIKNPPTNTRGQYRGTFCRASWGQDYHDILNERLEKLEIFIKKQMPEARCLSMVDTGELADRAVAARAGIGWSGKNCAIITPEFGSYVYLGEMITNISFAPDRALEDGCGTCRKCLDACPTGALVKAGQINAKRCLSYLTQTKEIIPEEYRTKIGNRLYGCDSCQTACPKNRKVDFHLHDEMEGNGEIVQPLLKPILHLSNRQFRQTYGHLAGAWRGKNPIQRNAMLALAHFKDESSLEEIRKILATDPRPVMRGTAAWAVSRISGKNAHEILTNAKHAETDLLVLHEINQALREIAGDNKTSSFDQIP